MIKAILIAAATVWHPFLIYTDNGETQEQRHEYVDTFETREECLAVVEAVRPQIEEIADRIGAKIVTLSCFEAAE